MRKSNTDTMIDVASYHSLNATIQEHQATLVAVSKHKPAQDILGLYQLGHRDFGENYVQELVDKYEHLPRDIRWHFIGHLQSNKVKYIAPFIQLVQSVDSFKLLLEINRQAEKNNRVIDVLLQVYTGSEVTKYGMDEKETYELLQYWEAQQEALKHVRITGLMGMGSLTEDPSVTRREFSAIRQLFGVLKTQFFLGQPSFHILSMGMSSDYDLALAEGSNMVRIGSTIFGSR